MPITMEIGSGTAAANPIDDLVSIAIHTGDTVTVKVGSGTSTVTNYQKGHSGGSTGTTTAGSTLTLTAVGTHYLSSASKSTVTISGGQYGT